MDDLYAFRQEVQEMTTADLMLVIEDQKELYSEEEFQILLDELHSRPDNALEIEEAEAERKAEEEERKAAEEERAARALALAKAHQEKLDALKRDGHEGYWEFKVVQVVDEKTGAVDPKLLEDTLNRLGLDGWRLKSAYSNEVGREEFSNGFNGMSTGTNATIDQNILIFERFKKI
nr:DUF4177 domain-containing protein [Clostridia bacterium]